MYFNYIHNLSLMIKVMGSLLITFVVTFLHVASIPSIDLDLRSIISIDKAIHIIMFYIVGLWFLLMVKKTHYILMMIFLIIFAFTMEYLQIRVSYRSFEWFDWLSDIFGLLLSFFHLSKKL